MNDATVIEAQPANDREGQLVGRLERLREAAVDAVTPTRALTMMPTEPDRLDEGSPAEENVLVRARTKPTEHSRLYLLEGAHRQVASKTGIPWRYYRRMLAEQPDLLAANVNRWWRDEPADRLLRMLRAPGDAARRQRNRLGARAAVRAFLSDRYKPLDHGALVETVLPALREHGAEVTDFELTDRHLHMRFASEAEDVLRRFAEEQPRLSGLEEVVRFGGAIRNSETGHGALIVAPAATVTRCSNVLVTTDRLREVHVGGRTEAEEGWMQEDTRRLDDASTFLKVRDKVVQIFSEEATERVARSIAEAAGEELELPEETPMMEFVDDVGRRFDLTEQERGVLQDRFVDEVQETGRRTRWSLAQAFTATARDVSRRGDAERTVDYDRRMEIEEVGWRVLESPASALLGG